MWSKILYVFVQKKKNLCICKSQTFSHMNMVDFAFVFLICHYTFHVEDDHGENHLYRILWKLLKFLKFHFSEYM